MKKIVLAIVLLLVLGLVACAPQQERVVKTTDVVEVEEIEDVEVEEPVDEPEVEEPVDEPEEVPEVEEPEEVPEVEEPKKELSITQEELDELGADLESMEFEDHGGLSE